jgi:hypothetical protein
VSCLESTKEAFSRRDLGLASEDGDVWSFGLRGSGDTIRLMALKEERPLPTVKNPAGRPLYTLVLL